jgi:hypothetical protein
MDHTKSKITVYESSDYKRFKSMEGNRAINKRKIERIIKEIQAGNDVLNESPILVTEGKTHLEIKDGQHRLEVCQQLKRPVHYIVKKNDMSILNVARVNSNTEKWSAQAFVHAYSKGGREDYKKLGAFAKKYGIAIGTCLGLLTYGHEKIASSGQGKESTLNTAFQNGEFKIVKYKEAVIVAELCKSFEQFPGWNSRSFISAIIRILQHGECDFDRLRKKFLGNPSLLVNQSSWKAYAANLQLIYNTGTPINKS